VSFRRVKDLDLKPVTNDPSRNGLVLAVCRHKRCKSQGEAMSSNGSQKVVTTMGSHEEKITIDVTAGGLQWWALYTRHQHEKQVADVLQRKGVEVFLPLYDSLRRWKDRRKVLSLPLFPCYVFVRGMRDSRLGILSTPGVHMILTRGEKAAEIPEEEIQAIRRSLDARFAVEPYPYLNCGDRVRVERGALEGIEGILVRKKNLFRLVISVEMLAQSVAVEIDATDVQPIRPSTLKVLEQKNIHPEELPRIYPHWGMDCNGTALKVG
jgi:transcription antitermination factor NusG